MKKITVRVNQNELDLLEKMAKEKSVSLSTVIRDAIKNNIEHKDILEGLNKIERRFGDLKVFDIFMNSAYCKIALEQLVRTTNQVTAINSSFEEFKKKEGIK